MSMLDKFENLTKHAIFPGNKDKILESMGLTNVINATNNKKIRTALSNSSEQFADMSRVVR